MTKEEFLEFAKSEEGKEILTKTNYSLMCKENVNNFLTTNEEGKSLLFSLQDKEYERRHKKFEEEKLPELLEKMYQEKHPDMTEEQKKIREMQQKIETFEKKELKLKNLKELSTLNKDFNLPQEIFEMLVGEDLEKSKSNIVEIGNRYKSEYEARLNKAIDEKLSNGYKPGADGGNSDTGVDNFEKALKGEI